MRVLALDMGSRRIGLALSDESGVHAFPEGALERVGRKRDLAALCALCRERDVGRVVVGLPLHMNGRRGPEAEAAAGFAAALAAATGLPVDTLDERWTTREADRALHATGRSGRRRKPGERDAVAAALLLRTWLDRERSRGD